VADAARRRGVLVRAIANKVVMSPPLTLKLEEADMMARALRDALQECC
jgi:adenosylmethionine-8-amino-7-oxononanoate aminotransferase